MFSCGSGAKNYHVKNRASTVKGAISRGQNTEILRLSLLLNPTETLDTRVNASLDLFLKIVMLTIRTDNYGNNTKFDNFALI